MGPGTRGLGEKFAGPSICVVRELSALASDACIHDLLWPSGDSGLSCVHDLVFFSTSIRRRRVFFGLGFTPLF